MSELNRLEDESNTETTPEIIPVVPVTPVATNGQVGEP